MTCNKVRQKKGIQAYKRTMSCTMCLINAVIGGIIQEQGGRLNVVQGSRPQRQDGMDGRDYSEALFI